MTIRDKACSVKKRKNKKNILCNGKKLPHWGYGETLFTPKPCLFIHCTTQDKLKSLLMSKI